MARNFDLAAMLASSQTSNARYQVLFQQSRPPAEMLKLWLPLLADRDNAIIAKLAALDAKRVKADKAAGAEAHAEANCVEGLALRNQGKYDDARISLADAVKKAGEAVWRKYSTDGLAELTDPAAFYLPAADALRKDNQHAMALKLLNRGVDAFAYDAKKGGRVLAMRAVVNAEAARLAAKGMKLDKNNPAIAAATKDARAALAAGAKADAYYALGRVAEVTGDYANANKNYRAAVAAIPPGDRNSTNLRVRLAAVLIRVPDVPPVEDDADEKKPADQPEKIDKKPKPAVDDEEKPAPKKPADKKPADDKKKDDKADDKKKDEDKKKDDKADDKKKDEDKKKDDKADDKKKDDEKGKDKEDKGKDKEDKGKDKDKDAVAPAEFFPLTAALAVAAALPGDDEEDRPTPELDEAIKLAEQAIREGNPEGHFVKALALARKNRWTEAVLEYSKGLEKTDKDPEHAKALRFLMENHPALRIPDGDVPIDPINAEKHYALGQRLYWTRQYAAAEKEFYQAVRYNDQDARFMYFLGLARLNQGKRSFAEASFKRGGMLEQANKPASATISSVLERVQGPDRQLLNRYRP